MSAYITSQATKPVAKSPPAAPPTTAPIGKLLPPFFEALPPSAFACVEPPTGVDVADVFETVEDVEATSLEVVIALLPLLLLLSVAVVVIASLDAVLLLLLLLLVIVD